MCVCVCVLAMQCMHSCPVKFECTVLYIWCLYFNSIALIQLQVSSSNLNSSSMWYLRAVFLANAKWFHRMCVFMQRHTEEKREWEWKKSVNNSTGKMATGFGEKKINSTHVHTRRYTEYASYERECLCVLGVGWFDGKQKATTCTLEMKLAGFDDGREYQHFRS